MDNPKYYTASMGKAQVKYQKTKMQTIGVKFHKELDWDIIARLNSVNSKLGYIKQLIRDDIKRTGWQVPPSPAELAAQEREAERLAEVERWHQIRAEANGSDGKSVHSGDPEEEARKLFGM